MKTSESKAFGTKATAATTSGTTTSGTTTFETCVRVGERHGLLARARGRSGRAMAAVLAVAAAACASVPVGADDRSMAELHALIGQAACSDDAQCATVGVGARACGGPASYLPWSRARTDERALRHAAERQAEASRARLGQSGMASICAMLPDPGAYCQIASGAAGRAGTCQLRVPGGSAGGGAPR